MTDAPVRSSGRPKDPAKHEAILAAAKELFLDRGFAQANMQEVADRAGVSKLTLYSHFGDKTTLFVAAVRDHYDHHLPDTIFGDWDREDLRGALLDFARIYHNYLILPGTIAGRRLLRAPGAPPELSQEIWNIGPARIDAFLATTLAGLATRRVLELDDPHLAAVHLLALIRGDLFAQLGYGVQRHVPGEETEAYLASAVDLFLRAYARVPGDW
ncbi:MAG: TetR/AcrR family transcriptional regulator [Xanthomonadales bacterium]|nr:TetR/AcrR family transcriptional regulator [Xanthomonadales bacterium]